MCVFAVCCALHTCTGFCSFDSTSLAVSVAFGICVLMWHRNTIYTQHSHAQIMLYTRSFYSACVSVWFHVCINWELIYVDFMLCLECSYMLIFLHVNGMCSVYVCNIIWCSTIPSQVEFLWKGYTRCGFMIWKDL